MCKNMTRVVNGWFARRALVRTAEQRATWAMLVSRLDVCGWSATNAGGVTFTLPALCAELGIDCPADWSGWQIEITESRKS
jgi:hypothetical protein